LRALLNTLQSANQEDRKLALEMLGNFTNRFSEVFPALVEGLHRPGLYDAARLGLRKLGRPAIAPLQDVAAKEEGTIRPATAALESLAAIQ
jgi:hypothetical protein